MPHLQLVFALIILLAAPAGWAATLEFRTDSRVDFILLLRALGEDSPHGDSAILRRAFAHFMPFRSHPAVSNLSALGKTGFQGALLPQYSVYLSSPPDLGEVHEVPEIFVHAAGGRERLDSFLKGARAFARESGFAQWHASEGKARAEMVAALSQTASGVDIERALVDFLGIRPWGRWIAVPSPFLSPEGGTPAWVLEEKKGLPDVYVFLRPRWTNGRPGFRSQSALAIELWSEPVYSAVYILYELCRPQVFPAKGLCDGLTGLTNDEACIMHDWAESVLYLLFERLFGPQEAKSTAEGRRRRVPTPEERELHRLLLSYGGQREQFPNLMAFGGRLLAPLQRDREPVVCRVVDEERFQEKTYSRRLGFYLDAILAQKSVPDLLLARARLREFHLELAGAREDLEEALKTAPKDWTGREESEEKLKQIKAMSL